MLSKLVPKVLVAISVSAVLFSATVVFRNEVRDVMLASDLWGAIDKGDTRKVQALIQRGANPNRIGAGGLAGGTPLTRATERSDTAIMKLLVQNGADVNKSFGAGWTALMFAETPEVARCLLRLGADPNLKNHNKQTALQMAKEYERPTVAAVLKPVTRP